MGGLFVSASTRIVRARSAALMPVVVPSRASTDTVNAVPRRASFRSTICGNCILSRRSLVIGTQMTPLAYLRMKATASGVTVSAAIVRSPSFSRSSSSTTMTIRPRRISSTASSIVVNGGSGDTTRGSGVTRRRFWVAISLKSRSAAIAFGDALHVFGDDVDLDVHRISWPQRAERGPLGGVRDERDLEERLPEARDRQAHAIDGDEALHDDVALEALR